MNTISQHLQSILKDIVLKEFGVHVEPSLEKPRDQAYGDLSTNVAMQIVKKVNEKAEVKMSPLKIAEKIKDAVSKKLAEGDSNIAADVTVVAPGFINFKLDESVFSGVLEEVLEKGDKFGAGEELKGKKIMVEFAHPNPFKSFHIGHLRNIILGESLVRLIESQGAEVIRVNYQGDVGMHIAKCIWAFRAISPDLYPVTADEKVKLLGESYTKGAAAYEESELAKLEIREINKKIYSREDEEINKLWKIGRRWSLEKFHEIYKRVDSTFHREYMETEVMELGVKKVAEAKEKGVLKESEGAIIFDGKGYGLDTRVFLNREGLPTYEGKELGLAFMEFTDFGEIDLCIHNVAVEQISFFKVTFKVQELLNPGLFKGKQYHNAYEFVGLKSGKMSSRRGNVVLGNDILNEARDKIKKERVVSEEIAEKVGLAAVKYSFLRVSPKTYLAFSMEESLNFEGDSGPYILYTYARAMSVINKKAASSWQQSEGSKKQVDGKNSKLEIRIEKAHEELEVLKKISEFPEVVKKAATDYAPNYVCAYVYELCQKFNHFYNSISILNGEDDNTKYFRVALTRATAQVIKNALRLLGINTVEKM